MIANTIYCTPKLSYFIKAPILQNDKSLCNEVAVASCIPRGKWRVAPHGYNDLGTRLVAVCCSVSGKWGGLSYYRKGA